MFLALREIRHEPVRFTLIISVITLVAYLTFFLASLAVGLAHRYRAGIDGWNTASVAVTNASNENLSASRLSDKQLNAATALAKDNGTTASALMSTAAVAQAPDVNDEDGGARSPRSWTTRTARRCVRMSSLSESIWTDSSVRLWPTGRRSLPPIARSSSTTR